MQPTATEIGGLALIVGTLALAQRLGGWESKPLARSLGVLTTCLLIAWFFMFFPASVAWTLSIAAAGVLTFFTTKWLNEFRSKAVRHRKPVETLHTIDFGYLPISPLERGWTKAYSPDGAAEFSTDPSIPGSLRIRVVTGVFAMDHVVPHHATLTQHLEFTAKYTDTTMIFVGVDVTSKDGSERKKVWIKYYYGRERSEATHDVKYDPNKELPEQTVWLPAQVLKGGSMLFDINFPDTVNQSLGWQGWVYKSIWRIRLRGSVSISPVSFGK
jgi:hypothetical protein